MYQIPILPTRTFLVIVYAFFLYFLFLCSCSNLFCWFKIISASFKWFDYLRPAIFLLYFFYHTHNQDHLVKIRITWLMFIYFSLFFMYIAFLNMFFWLYYKIHENRSQSLKIKNKIPNEVPIICYFFWHWFSFFSLMIYTL